MKHALLLVLAGLLALCCSGQDEHRVNLGLYYGTASFRQKMYNVTQPEPIDWGGGGKYPGITAFAYFRPHRRIFVGGEHYRYRRKSALFGDGINLDHYVAQVGGDIPVARQFLANAIGYQRVWIGLYAQWGWTIGWGGDDYAGAWLHGGGAILSYSPIRWLRLNVRQYYARYSYWKETSAGTNRDDYRIWAFNYGLSANLFGRKKTFAPRKLYDRSEVYRLEVGLLYGKKDYKRRFDDRSYTLFGEFRGPAVFAHYRLHRNIYIGAEYFRMVRPVFHEYGGPKVDHLTLSVGGDYAVFNLQRVIGSAESDHHTIFVGAQADYGLTGPDGWRGPDYTQVLGASWLISYMLSPEWSLRYQRLYTWSDHLSEAANPDVGRSYQRTTGWQIGLVHRFAVNKKRTTATE